MDNFQKPRIGEIIRYIYPAFDFQAGNQFRTDNDLPAADQQSVGIGSKTAIVMATVIGIA